MRVGLQNLPQSGISYRPAKIFSPESDSAADQHQPKFHLSWKTNLRPDRGHAGTKCLEQLSQAIGKSSWTFFYGLPVQRCNPNFRIIAIIFTGSTP